MPVRAGRRTFLVIALAVVAAAAALATGMVSVARQSIQFDLRAIGESIYEAHATTGRWPTRVVDLEGTTYLKMPHRRDLLEQGVYVVVWQTDLAAEPGANRNRILAYDSTSLIARFGWIWACRGDLSIDRISPQDIAATKARAQ